MSGAAAFGDPRPYSAAEIHELGQRLAAEAEFNRGQKYDLYRGKNIPYVRGCMYRGPGDIVEINIRRWLMSVWDGKLLPHNPYIKRGFRPKGKHAWRNHRLWRHVSDVCRAEFRYWEDIKDDVTSIYPRLWQLIFRMKEDFYCGSWHHFRDYWKPFVDEIPNSQERDEVWESLVHGADTLSYSQKIDRKDAVQHRKNIKLFTKAVRSRTYVRLRLGRSKFKHKRRPNSVIGYVPSRFYSDPNKREDFLEIKTNRRNSQYYSTIFDKMLSWLNEGTVKYIGQRAQLGRSFVKKHVRCILSLVVEARKPRLCIDGSPLGTVGPKKKPLCKLDTVSMAIDQLEKDMLLTKTDDRNGFMHSFLSEESAKSCFVGVGDALFRAQGMVFGLTVSPQKFQQLNKVLVAALVRRGYRALLYLDDRLAFARVTRALVGTETTVANYLMVVGLTMFGGFLSLDKSELIPNHLIEFLGFLLNSHDQTVSVPQHKHEKFCQLVDEWAAQPVRDYKTLEKLRGKAISWLLVLTNSKLFIREMNSVIAKAVAEEWADFPPGYLEKTGVFRELKFWTSLTPSDLIRPWRHPHHGLIHIPRCLNKTRVLYTDASSYKLGGCLLINGRRVYRSFGLSEMRYQDPIHIKEMMAIVECIRSLKPELTGHRIKLMCDNMSVVAAWQGDGCKDMRLNRMIIDLYYLLREIHCALQIEWCSTHDQLGDAPSREISPHDDSILRPHLADLVVLHFQPNLDCYAEHHNTLCGRYISRFEEEHNIWQDALSYTSIPSDRLFVYAPRALVGASLNVLVKPAARCLFMYHVYNNHDAQYGECERLFDFRIQVGGVGNPSCLTVCAHRRDSHPERAGYRLYREPTVSYLYVKGYSEELVTLFAARVYSRAAYKQSGVGTYTKL